MAGIYDELAEIYEQGGFTRFSREMAPRIPDLLRRYRRTPTRICDLACGTGDAGVYLAQQGYEVIGIDASARMLAQARSKGDAAGVRVAWLQADARNFVLQRPVEVVTCMYDALNYMLTEQDLAAVFGCVRDCLQPGGLFIFDMNTRAGLAEEWGTSERIDSPGDELFMTWQTTYDHESEVNTLVLTAFVRQPAGLYRRIREVHHERGYPVARVRELCEAAGLAVAEIGDLELRPLTGDSERFLCVAERR